jgi:hypothetical protein
MKNEEVRHKNKNIKKKSHPASGIWIHPQRFVNYSFGRFHRTDNLHVTHNHFFFFLPSAFLSPLFLSFGTRRGLHSHYWKKEANIM